MKRLNNNFAVIGSAHGHILEFIEDMLKSGGTFKGIYDDHSPLCRQISEKYSVQVWEDMEALLNSGVDIIGTSAINCDKIDIIERCGQKGIHVIADKPIVIDGEQYQRLEKIVASSGIEIGMMLTARYMPEIFAAKNIISNGKIGKLLNIEIFNPHRLSAQQRPDWHFDKKRNGGIIIDLMPHSVDLFRWLTEDDITEYQGVMKKSILREKTDFFDVADFFVTSNKGVTGYFRVDWHMPDAHWTWGDMRVFCTGTEGCIEIRAIGDPLTKKRSLIYYSKDKGTYVFPTEKCCISATIDFLNRVNGKNYVVGQRDVLEVSRLCVEFDASAKIINMIL